MISHRENPPVCPLPICVVSNSVLFGLSLITTIASEPANKRAEGQSAKGPKAHALAHCVFFQSYCPPSVPQAEETKRVDVASSEAVPSFGGADGGDDGGRESSGGSRVSPRRREASVVLVDRTLDLAAAASRGGSLLQRVRYKAK